ncbi:dUTP diphosphatase [Caldifermentibacillus hisashii]|uniref:dUTP diphosphatase n=1 Tax=Caldifermentibacillus hisashii TaxID=996558 RepID=UPI0031B70861
MNLQNLFELQKQLDEHIEKIHPRQEGEDRLAKKILALQVELAECAQESRCFKYWSHNQEPRLKGYKEIKCKWCNGSGDDGSGVCPDCKCEGYVYKEYNPLLEEYVDCLHFILSIGNDIIGELTDSEIEDILLNAKEDSGNIVDSFIVLNRYSCELKFREKYDYISLLTIFLSLGLTFGFTWDQVEQGYLAKNKINHERQESGY